MTKKHPETWNIISKPRSRSLRTGRFKPSLLQPRDRVPTPGYLSILTSATLRLNGSREVYPVQSTTPDNLQLPILHRNLSKILSSKIMPRVQSSPAESKQTPRTVPPRKRKLPDQSKFYAVRAGHETGVFISWKDCEKNITGFKGANCEL